MGSHFLLDTYTHNTKIIQVLLSLRSDYLCFEAYLVVRQPTCALGVTTGNQGEVLENTFLLIKSLGSVNPRKWRKTPWR